MAAVVYTRGLDQLSTWTSGTYRLALIGSAAFVAVRSNEFVTALSGSEVTGVSYSRATLTSTTRIADDTNNLIRYDANDPSFGTPTSGQTVYGMALFRFVTNDADSLLISYYPFVPTVTTSSSTFSVVLNSGGLAYTLQG